MKLNLDNAFKWVVVKNALENDKERMENEKHSDVHQSDIEVIDELLNQLDENCYYKEPQ